MKFGGVFLQILAAATAALIVGGVIGSQGFPTIVRETLTNTVLETVSTTTTLVSTETLTQTTSVTTTNTVTVRETLYRTLTVTSTPTVVISVIRFSETGTVRVILLPTNTIMVSLYIVLWL
jgi:subtilisin family serine protease